MKTEAQALAWLCNQVEMSSDPTLTLEEVRLALEDNQTAQLWVASTPYSVGDRVAPGTGRFYRCLQSGTTSATAPSWPGYATWRIGQMLTDGTVVWVDDGMAMGERYDLPGAAKQLWQLKARKAAAYFNSSDKDANLQEQQIYQHCVERAAAYESTWVP